MDPIDVLVRRKDTVEAVHKVYAVAFEGEKRVAVFGDPHWKTYWRSTAKPFQAIALVHSGAADRLGVTAEELAIAAGSHAGSARHVGIVDGMLKKGGLTPGHLQCAPHEPFDRTEARRLCREGRDPTTLHSNCSGKHAAMLLTAQAIGQSLDTYTDPSHPVQLMIQQILSEATDDPAIGETVVSDGCGAPIWASRLEDVARAFQKWATGNFAYGEASRRIFQSMIDYPDMVAGVGHWNTRLIEELKPHFAGKGGAEGLFGGAFADGRSLAVKVLDGQHRATPIAVTALMERLGWLSSLEKERLADLMETPLTTLSGKQVGIIRPAVPVR